MKKLYIIFLFIIAPWFLIPLGINAQCVSGNEFNNNAPKRDMRGVFIPTLFNISWPSNSSATPAVQQAELIAILDNVQANGYNSVFLQVRPAGDALYASAIEPWSNWLTGVEGTPPSPFWDPLEFAVTEAHARGLDLHAWLNPYRVKYGSYTNHPNHIINEQPTWTFAHQSNANLIVLDPGLPQVRDYIVSIVEDIASRYDVDGIHFDDYFYLNGGMANPPNNQDAQTFLNHNPGSLSLENWRRDNVNQMIGMVFDALQTINTTNNKNVVFGVSPFGIWKSGTPPGITGTSSYSALYCDPIAWMQQSKVDYIAPQLYWAFGGGQDYDILSQWWNDQADTYNTQLYISQAYYKMDAPQNWAASEIQNQINENREVSMDATFGQIAYRYNEIGNNLKGINTALNASQFLYKSFAPPIVGAGKDVACPNNPDNIRFEPLKIVWDTPSVAGDGDLPKKYVVYAFNNAAQATTNKNDGSKILDIIAGNELSLTQSQIDTKFIVVTSLDKNNNEAGDFCNRPLPIITAPCSVTSITAPTAKFNCTGSYTGTTSTVFPIESTTEVIWNYDFGGGNTFTQTQNVIISDSTPPNVITQNIIVTLTGPSVTISAGDVNNGSSDNCAIESLSLDKYTFTCSDIGVNTVTLTITDKNGNSASANALVTVEGELTEYSISGWSNGIPHLGSLAKISGNYSTNNGNLDACICEITSSGTLTVEPGHYINIQGDIIVDGNLIVEHQGSIVQTDNNANVVNNGTINVKQTTPSLGSRDFMILGSPMSNESRIGVWGSAFLVLNHNTLNFVPNNDVAIAFPGSENFADDNYNNWIEYNSGINLGEGYIVRPQAGYGQPGGIFDYTYSQGTLNNGIVNFNVIYNTPGPTSADNRNASPNILANPYPSAISADDFISANPMINEVYFWEHLTPPSPSYPGAGSMNFSMQDISMYNLTGGTAAANDPGTTTQPNGIISTGQGFAIKASAAGVAEFNNSMRLLNGNNTLRSSANIDYEINRERIWITLNSNDYDLQNTTLLGFSGNTTNELDLGYDSRCLATVIAVYTLLDDGSEQLGIQSRGKFKFGTKVSLGFSSQILGLQEYEISIANLEGHNLSGASVYLWDNENQSMTKINNTPYKFKSKDGIFNERFTLLFKRKAFKEDKILENDDVTLEQLYIFPNPTKGIVNVSALDTPIKKVIIYDLQGRIVSSKSFNDSSIQIDISSLSPSIYLMNITTEKVTYTRQVVKK